jgi:cysteine desulfurase
MQRVYLDNSATTRVNNDVVAAMLRTPMRITATPEGTHQWGQRSRQAIEDSRRQVAKALNASPGEIIFVSGGTESDNLAIRASPRRTPAGGAT